MLHNAVEKLRSQRGASLSVALLVILVCIVVSAAVLAASSASAGQFAGRSESDQRYYSVTSAARLFQDSLDENGELTLVYTQKKTGTRAADGTMTVSTAQVSLEPDSAASTPSTSGYDFLPAVTSLALYGKNATEAALEPTLKGGWGNWVEPFSWMLGTQDYEELTYTVEPSVDGVDDSDIQVDVTARLWRDWTLELDFASAAASANDPNVFHLYMVFAANVDNDVRSWESAGEATATRTVTWQLERIVPGRGIVDAD